MHACSGVENHAKCNFKELLLLLLINAITYCVVNLCVKRSSVILPGVILVFVNEVLKKMPQHRLNQILRVNKSTAITIKLSTFKKRLPYSKAVYPAIILFSCLMEVNHGAGSRPNDPFR